MEPEIIPARLGTGARGGFTADAGGDVRDAAGPGRAGADLRLQGSTEPGRTADNRARLAGALGVPVHWMRQVHGSRVATVTEPPVPHREPPEADALVADARGLGIDLAVGVLVADCVPVLLASAHSPVIAAAHVGRNGLVAGVLPAALRELERRDVLLDEVFAAVGPSICGRCYEVPASMREDVEAQVPGTAATTSWGTPAIDVPAGVLGQLATAGVRRVHHVDRCTYTDKQFYSYRRSGITGRFAGVVRTVADD